MACENPIWIDNPRYSSTNIDYWREYFLDIYGYEFLPDKRIQVPCGRCASCQRSRLNGFRLRLLNELERYPSSLFLTFTFDDYNLKRFKGNYNRSVRLFLDRIRKKYGKGFRHFFIAEYGENSGRFHYHGILFNVDYIPYDEMKRLWSYGHIYIGYCDQKTCHYICKYLTKENKSGEKLPRIIASKGLGASFLDSKDAKYIKSKNLGYLPSGGYAIPLPRYYLTKLYDDDERILNQLCNKHEPFKRVVEGRTYYDERSYRDAVKRVSDKFLALGISKEIEKIPRVSKIRPVSQMDCRYVSPWDRYDFNTRREKEIIDSCFEVEPF